MDLRKLFLAGMMMLCVLSCTKTKVTMNDVSLEDTLILMEGKPYTGEVWSSDTCTWCIQTVDGHISAFTLYHDNGTVAYTMESPADTLNAFNDAGSPISLDSFTVSYPELSDEIPELMKQLKGQSD